jgi:hypothetical protein
LRDWSEFEWKGQVREKDWKKLQPVRIFHKDVRKRRFESKRWRVFSPNFY